MSAAPFVARVSRRKALAVTLMMLAAAVLALWITVTTVASRPPAGFVDGVNLLLCVAVTAIFFYGIYWVGRALFRRGEALVLDETGLRIPRSFDGVLRWDAVARAQVVRGQLHLWLVENAPIPAGRAFEHLAKPRADRPGGPDGADLAVSLWLTDRLNRDLIEAARARAPQLFA